MIEIASAALYGDAAELAALCAALSQAERQRAARFPFERDRRRFIVARSRLRRELAARLGVPPEAVELERGDNGKPKLAPRFAASGWRFNVSHSEELALYAFARGCEVGVDLEALRALPEADALAAACFSPGERDAYRAAAPQHQPLAFLRGWTRKEALLKALGVGLGVALEALDASRPEPRRGWRVESFFPRAGFVAAVASVAQSA